MKQEQHRSDRLESQLASLQRQHHHDQQALQAAEADRSALRRGLLEADEKLECARDACVQLEREAEDASDLKGQLRDTEAALSQSQKHCDTLHQQCAAAEQAQEKLAAKASAEAADLVRRIKVQEGLRQMADVGMREAIKELAAVKQLEGRLQVDNQLLKDRIVVSEARNAEAAQHVSKLQRQLAEVAEPYRAAAAQEVAQAMAQVQQLRGSLADAERRGSEQAAALRQQRRTVELKNLGMRQLGETNRQLRASWRRAEAGQAEMSRARLAAEQSKLELVEALILERAARILAQQELEGAVGSGSMRAEGTGADRTRLALLHEELSSERRTLSMVLDVVQEMQQQRRAEPSISRSRQGALPTLGGA